VDVEFGCGIWIGLNWMWTWIGLDWIGLDSNGDRQGHADRDRKIGRQRRDRDKTDR
jgi:hypothetical protein